MLDELSVECEQAVKDYMNGVISAATMYSIINEWLNSRRTKQ